MFARSIYLARQRMRKEKQTIKSPTFVCIVRWREQGACVNMVGEFVFAVMAGGYMFTVLFVMCIITAILEAIEERKETRYLKNGR